jgi:hypothetical protein
MSGIMRRRAAGETYQGLSYGSPLTTKGGGAPGFEENVQATFGGQLAGGNNINYGAAVDESNYAFVETNYVLDRYPSSQDIGSGDAVAMFAVGAEGTLSDSVGYTIASMFFWIWDLVANATVICCDKDQQTGIGYGNNTPSATLHVKNGKPSTGATSVKVSPGAAQTSASVLMNVEGQLKVATHTPASAGATGEAGQIAWDAHFLYICVATNTWKRVAISTW